MTNDFIDFPVSPLFAAYYAERGLTPALPDGFPVDRPQRFEPLPDPIINEAEWAERAPEVLRAIAWAQYAANTWTPDEWHNHDIGEMPEQTAIITPIRPAEPQGGRTMPTPAPAPEPTAPIVVHWRSS